MDISTKLSEEDMCNQPTKRKLLLPRGKLSRLCRCYPTPWSACTSSSKSYPSGARAASSSRDRLFPSSSTFPSAGLEWLDTTIHHYKKSVNPCGCDVIPRQLNLSHWNLCSGDAHSRHLHRLPLAIRIAWCEWRHARAIDIQLWFYTVDQVDYRPFTMSGHIISKYPMLLLHYIPRPSQIPSTLLCII